MSQLDEKIKILQSNFNSAEISYDPAIGEINMEVPREQLQATAQSLRDEPQCHFEQLIDLCGVDYLDYGSPDSEWQGKRFAVVYHLLSIKRNDRLRLRVRLDENDTIIPTVTSIWNSADWYEREAFDLYGILFDGHEDLRRILTDYGFIGHPFRKDFPLSGHVEMRYDPEKKRVVYQPVSIEPRILVPKIIRQDHRYVANKDGKP